VIGARKVAIMNHQTCMRVRLDTAVSFYLRSAAELQNGGTGNTRVAILRRAAGTDSIELE
jgi:hypothetical protein